MWIAEEADSFSERGLVIGRIRRPDMVDDVCLDALPRATIYEDGELESERLSDMRSSWLYRRTLI
jgi:hypothetical protein